MAVGLSATGLANGWLNVLRGTTFTGITNVYVQLHTADPGSAGTTGVSAGSTTRPVITWSAAAGGSMSMTGTAPSWTNGGTTETLSHISFWTASSAGTFLGSAALSSTQSWASGNTFALSAQTWTITPIAS